jgi:hypothetical protein
MIDGRMMTAPGMASRTAASPAALGAGLHGFRVRIGADGGDMDQPRDSGGAGRLRDRPGAVDMDGLETLAPGFVHDGDEIDDGMRPGHGALDRFPVAYIGLHGMDLADRAERPQEARQIGPAHRDPNPVAAFRQRPHHIASNESRSAEHCDELVAHPHRRHVLRPPLPPAPAGRRRLDLRPFNSEAHAACIGRIDKRAGGQ